MIAGEGEERAALERLAAELGVADRVTFAGRLTDEQLLDAPGALPRGLSFRRSRRTTGS